MKILFYILSVLLCILLLVAMIAIPIDFKNDYLYYITIPVAMIFILYICKMVKWLKNLDLDIDPNE